MAGNRVLLAFCFSLIFSITVLPSEENLNLSGSFVLFGNDASPPVLLDSRRDWMPIGTIHLSQMADRPLENIDRRWRIRTSYEHERTSGSVTLQIRLKIPGAVPVFTHPWSEGADRKTESYSNWYEDHQSNLTASGSGIVEARLIAPPRTPLTGKLHSVTLESWEHDLPQDRERGAGSAPDIQLAYARPLPTEEARMRRTQIPESGPEKALEFALDFVEACITGDLPSYYRAHSDTVRSLDDGTAMVRYRLRPPVGILNVDGIDEFKQRFEYKIYGVDTYKELFPEWFDSSRPWVPSETASYLFMGQKDRHSDVLPESIDYLVFLVEADSNGNWSIVARPGQ